tara:strand:- start:234 stop:866 length:633 start_codon:yes stop_codon:yes gene_type:complete
MNEELKFIRNQVSKAFGVKIESKESSIQYFLGRHAFYHYSRSLLRKERNTSKSKDTIPHLKKYSLHKIAFAINKDYTSVIASIKKHDVYVRDFPEYSKNYQTLLDNLEAIKRKMEIEDYANMKEHERKSKMLQHDVEDLKKVIEELEGELLLSEKKAKNDTPFEIRNLLSALSDEEIKSFIEYKVNPALIMHNSQQRRLINYNPRQNKTA